MQIGNTSIDGHNVLIIGGTNTGIRFLEPSNYEKDYKLTLDGELLTLNGEFITIGDIK